MVTAFAGHGARVAFVDIQDDASAALVRSLSHCSHPPVFLPCDITDTAALQGTIAHIRKELGPIAVLINNAANDERHPIDEVTPEYWDSAMNVNLRHAFFAAQAVRPHMKELGHGSIINFSSTAWMYGGADFVAYSTAKSGVIGLTYALARAFGGDNIRVNAIAPGAVVTERQLRLWYSEAGRRDGVAADDQAAALAGRHCPRRAFSRRGRQPHDHQAVHRRRRGAAVMLQVGLNPYGLTYVLGLQGAARRAPIPRAAASKDSSRSPRNWAPRRSRSSNRGWRR